MKQKCGIASGKNPLQKLQAVQLQQMKKERVTLYNSKALFEQLYDVMIVYLLGFFNLPK